MKKSRRRDGSFFLAMLPLYVTTLVFVLLPILYVVALSFMKRDATWGVTSEFTLENYIRLWDPIYLEVLLDSLKLAVKTTLLAFAIGYPFAYCMAKLPPRRRGIVMLLVIVPFWTNALVRIYGWMILLRANGVVNTLLLEMGIVEYPPLKLLYTDGAILLGMVLLLLPFMILPSYTSIEKLDWSLVEAARDLGAGKSVCVSDRDAEADAAGDSVRLCAGLCSVHGPVFYIRFVGGRQESPHGESDPKSDLDSPQLAFWRGALCCDDAHDAALFVYLPEINKTEPARGHGIGGKRMSGKKHTRRWGSGIYSGVILALMYIPIVLVIVYSFNKQKISAVWGGFSLDWYRVLFQDRQMMGALWNSLKLGISSCLISGVIGTLGAVGMTKGRFRTAGMVESIATLPIMIPEIILGIAFLTFFSFVGIPYGMPAMIIGHCTFCIPYIFINVRTRLLGIDPSVEEAARDLGAGRGRVFRDITLPLIAPGILSGMLLAFAMSLDDVIISFFLAGPTSTTLPVRVYSQLKTAVTPEINALCTLTMGVTFFIVIVSQILGANKFKKNRREEL